MKNYTFRKPALTTAITTALLAFNVSQANATNYTFSDLDTVARPSDSPIMGIALNNNGHILGWRGTATGLANGEVYATVWDGTSWNELPTIPGSTDHEMRSINDHGQVTGWVGFAPAQDLYVNYRYDNGVPVATARLSDTSWFAGGGSINNSGQIAGGAFEDDWEAVRWDADGSIHRLTDLGGSNADTSAINDHGEIVGTSDNPGDDYNAAVYWDAQGNLTALQTLSGQPGGGWAADINNLGQIVGTTNDGAVLWENKDAAPELISTLSGFHGWVANDINDHGQMVGWAIIDGVNRGHVFLWDQGTITDLSLLIPAALDADGWRLAAYMPHINNLGQISGYLANTDGRFGAYMLTPTSVPVPGAVWLFGSALAGFMSLRRKAIK